MSPWAQWALLKSGWARYGVTLGRTFAHTRSPAFAMRNRSVVLIASLALLQACASTSTTRAGDVIAITGVSVVDPSSSQPALPDQTILIADDVIRAVGTASSILGLWDTHVHSINSGITASGIATCPDSIF